MRLRTRSVFIVLGILFVLTLFSVWLTYERFFREFPQEAWVTADEDTRFLYGSIGGEVDAGIPYWIFYVLPRVFPEKLPGNGAGYAAFGPAWEQGRELPAGFTKKRIGFDRVGNNCASCHTASYRLTHDSNPVFVPTGPNHRLALQDFFRFLVLCAQDPRFNSDVLMREIALVTDLDLIDSLAYRFVIIPMTKKRLLEREAQFAWIFRPDFPHWGRGRDDAMNLTKYFMLEWKMDDTLGPTDMPSLWNIDKYKPEAGQRMNWAGDSNDPRSVIIDSALGVVGAAPRDNAAFLREIDWLHTYLAKYKAPKFPLPVDAARATQGKAVFDQQCATCHASPRTGTVVPLAEIGTDDKRILTWTKEAAVAANRVVREMGIERPGLVEAPLTGYVAQHLDGIWLRAPYLHNGSVPTLRDLLEPPAQRPTLFHRGYDLLDPQKVGFVSTGPRAEQVGTPFDVRLHGNGNGGHDFGTTLPAADKDALVEYLKTL
ncbi:MAG: hypothetical protein REI94_14965 [Moraxellaceae bacterium]|nr:hypothetical protein [Moraxellaceae bacterium]